LKQYCSMVPSTGWNWPLYAYGAGCHVAQFNQFWEPANENSWNQRSDTYAAARFYRF
ncbi:hypothetical protein Tco_1339136, partial [Tanacetum coccineum]